MSEYAEGASRARAYLSEHVCVGCVISSQPGSSAGLGGLVCRLLIGATAPTAPALKAWRCPLLLIFARNLAGVTRY